MAQYVRQRGGSPQTSVSSPSLGSLAGRRCCRLLPFKALALASLISLTTVLYWIHYTGFMEDIAPSWTGLARSASQQIPTNSLVEISDVINDADLTQFDTAHLVLFLFCGESPVFDYLNYLSVASVLRAYEPSRTIILYETHPPRLDGNLSSLTAAPTLMGLLQRCESFTGFTRMKNGSHICSNTNRLHEFVSKLLFRYGGLYVGRRTFMTSVTSYLRSSDVKENVIFYVTGAELEGFLFVRESLAETANSTTNVPLALSRRESRRLGGAKHVQMRIYKSREVRCFESATYSTDILHSPDGNSFYSCVVLSPSSDVTPKGVLSMRSDFGQFARKAVFNIHNDWETRYYIKATNSTAVPLLCGNKDTGDMGPAF